MKHTRRSYRERKPPRQHSADVLDPNNQTDLVPGQEDWSIDNLPEILYQFRPDPNKPQVRRDANIPTKPSPWKGCPPLRDFPILPDRISSNVEEYRVEAWMRLDRRIQLHDITDRMNPKFRVENNALQQRGVRFRKAFNLLAWGTGNRKTEEMASKLMAMMERRGIDPENNSTRGMTPGLIDPAAGEEGGRIPVPEPYRSRYPVNNTIFHPVPQRVGRRNSSLIKAEMVSELETNPFDPYIMSPASDAKVLAHPSKEWMPASELGYTTDRFHFVPQYECLSDDYTMGTLTHIHIPAPHLHTIHPHPCPTYHGIPYFPAAVTPNIGSSFTSDDTSATSSDEDLHDASPHLYLSQGTESIPWDAIVPDSPPYHHEWPFATGVAAAAAAAEAVSQQQLVDIDVPPQPQSQSQTNHVCAFSGIVTQKDWEEAHRIKLEDLNQRNRLHEEHFHEIAEQVPF